jgi:5-methylthioadenosine/S-adenosylhomocysteine deaminase
MQTIDTLISAQWVVPIEPAGLVLEDHAVAVHLGKVVEVLPESVAREKFAARRHIALPQHVLIPGLINLHTHAAMTLMRGLADDLPLMTWLSGHVWPAEGRHVSDEFVYDGSLLACAEMLRAGVTCFNDMYFFPEATARAALAARMRAMLGIIAIEFPSAYAADADTSINKGLAARDTFGGESLLGFALAPHAPYTVSDRTFERIVTLARELDIPIHIHLHETHEEIAQSEREYGMRPLLRLDHLGVLGPNLIAVHAIHLTPQEIELLAQTGCHVAHCPASNLKLASGFAPVKALFDKGVNTGIGTDGAASNNRLDMMAEIRLAALLAKGASGDAAAIPAAQALAMSTINAARALGLDEQIGSIIAGKRADLIAIELSQLEATPCFDVVSHIVYVCSRENVSHVWVDGELLLDDRTLIHIDEQEIKAKARLWKARIKP